MYQISVIIPTLNEAAHIGELLQHLRACSESEKCELIVVDGGSKDGTQDIVRKHKAQLLNCQEAHRAVQMNQGAKAAIADILYFVHADSRPPQGFVNDLLNAVQVDQLVGCYPFSFDSNRPLLKMNSYFTRFDLMTLRGGDQTLFITKQLFDELNGYDISYDIMEEYDLIKRARRKTNFNILKTGAVKVSARKYEHNSYVKVNLVNFMIFNLYRLGVSPKRLKRLYFRLIDHPKS